MSLFSGQQLQAIKSKNAQVKKHKILIVDDEAANLKVMSSILRITYDIITATNGREALALINDLDDPSSLSMIISDQRMPFMTGVEMFEETVASFPDVLRIIVSGYSDMSAVISAINKARIFHFISKPFDRTEFLIIVKQSLKTYDFKQAIEQEKCVLQEQLILCKDARALKEIQLQRALKILNENNLSINIMEND